MWCSCRLQPERGPGKAEGTDLGHCLRAEALDTEDLPNVTWMELMKRLRLHLRTRRRKSDHRHVYCACNCLNASYLLIRHAGFINPDDPMRQIP